MTTSTLPTADRSIDTALATLVLAFSTDPVIRWTLPDTAGYVEHFPALVTGLGGAAFDAGTADLDDGGAALWVPPGAAADDTALEALLLTAIDPARHDTAFAFLAQVAEHHVDEPHWYLPFIGVDPGRQGEGRGSALLARGLTRCDRDRLPAYLEASTPRNRALYERHGFVVVGEVRAGDSPPLWPMLRPAR